MNLIPHKSQEGVIATAPQPTGTTPVRPRVGGAMMGCSVGGSSGRCRGAVLYSNQACLRGQQHDKVDNFLDRGFGRVHNDSVRVA